MLGGEHTAKSVRCLRDFGRVIVYGAATGQPAHSGRAHPLRQRRERARLWLTYLSAKRELMDQAWKQLSAWTAQGHLRPGHRPRVSLGESCGSLPVAAGGKELRQGSAQVRPEFSTEEIVWRSVNHDGDWENLAL